MREKPFDSIWDSIIEFGETDGGVKSNLRIPKRRKDQIWAKIDDINLLFFFWENTWKKHKLVLRRRYSLFSTLYFRQLDNRYII